MESNSTYRGLDIQANNPEHTNIDGYYNTNQSTTTAHLDQNRRPQERLKPRKAGQLFHELEMPPPSTYIVSSPDGRHHYCAHKDCKQNPRTAYDVPSRVTYVFYLNALIVQNPSQTNGSEPQETRAESYTTCSMPRFELCREESRAGLYEGPRATNAPRSSNRSRTNPN